MSPAEAPYCVVQTTLATGDEAADLARRIVAARLGACVQIQPIRSFYVWQGQTQDEPEWLLSIKTRHALYPALEAFIRTHHRYETPEIICLPITAGSAAYLAWVEQGTQAD